MANQLLIINEDELEEKIEKFVSKAFSKVQPKSNSGPLTLPEAAAYCKMPVSTFRMYLSKRNTISGSKVGKEWKFYTDDLDVFIKKYRRNNREDSINSPYQLGLRKK